MDARAHYAVGDAYAEAWRLKGNLIAIHLATLVVFALVLTPLAALAMSVALWVSGAPALTDKDIALFVLSPSGAAAMTAIAALYLVLQVVGIAAKMAVLSAHRAERDIGSVAALRLVAGRGGRLLRFAFGLVLRIALFALPVLVLGGAAAAMLLTDYDINYYLSARPAAFWLASAIGLALLGGLAATLLPRLLGWALALPLVLLSDVAPGESFAQSARAMHGRRGALLIRLLYWGAIAFGAALGLALFAALGGGLATALAGNDVARLARLLVGVLACYGALSILIGAFTSGALAHLLLDEADWPQAVLPAAPARETGLRGATALAGLALVIAAGAGLATTLPPPLAPPSDIAIIAHRGGAADRPENTLAAMRHGVVQGADWLEIDVQESAEGDVIVVHDSDFMKVARVPTKVWDITAAELATIDIGSWFAPDYASERVPRLSEVLEVARDRSKVLIELKYYGHDTDLAERVAAAVEAADMTDQVAAMSLDPRQAARMKAARPGWQVGLLAATALGRLDRIEADFLAVSTALATPTLLRRADAAGRDVYVWTVNDAAAMARMAGLGVSGLITDRPALARAVLNDLADLSAPERLALSIADTLGLDLADEASPGAER